MIINNHGHVGDREGLFLFGIGGCWGSIINRHCTFAKLFV